MTPTTPFTEDDIILQNGDVIFNGVASDVVRQSVLNGVQGRRRRLPGPALVGIGDDLVGELVRAPRAGLDFPPHLLLKQVDGSL